MSASSEQEQNDVKKLEFIFGYATPVLREFLLKKYDIDLSSVYKVPSKNPEIRMKVKDKEFILQLEVVNKDYELNYDNILKYTDNEEEKEKVQEELTMHCTFLVNAVNSAFNFFKRTLKTSKDDEEYFLIFISMGINENTNLYIDDEDEDNIGIVIREV